MFILSDYDYKSGLFAVTDTADCVTEWYSKHDMLCINAKLAVIEGSDIIGISALENDREFPCAWKTHEHEYITAILGVPLFEQDFSVVKKKSGVTSGGTAYSKTCWMVTYVEFMEMCGNAPLHVIGRIPQTITMNDYKEFYLVTDNVSPMSRIRQNARTGVQLRGISRNFLNSAVFGSESENVTIFWGDYVRVKNNGKEYWFKADFENRAVLSVSLSRDKNNVLDGIILQPAPYSDGEYRYYFKDMQRV